MRVLIISDVHANLAALEAVLADAAGQYEAAWCLGDSVGYGPEPDECVTRIRELGATAVVGNHDWAALSRMDVDDFNPEAKRAVLWTREQLSAENMAWLGSLPSQPLVQGAFTLTHGSPRDPVWEYILYPSIATANFDNFSTPFCLVGHTHIPMLYVQSESDHKVRALVPVFGKRIALGDGWRIILNPGSVGQPRDNDPRSAYAILDTDAATWEARRGLPHRGHAGAHAHAHLPERLINRLAFGW